MPYGETRVESGQRLDLGYTGHKWDAETKQYFAPYRYYSPTNSRWLSRDPLGFVDGPNVYAYVGGMPTVAVDPSGGFWQLAIPVGAACLKIAAKVLPKVSKYFKPKPAPKQSPKKKTPPTKPRLLPPDPSKSAIDGAKKILRDKNPGPPWIKDRRNWHNPRTKESISPKHHDKTHDPHVDYHPPKSSGQQRGRIDPSGKCTPK